MTFSFHQSITFEMQGAIGLDAKANGLEYALFGTTWILNQTIVWSLRGAKKPPMPSAPHTFLLLQTRSIIWLY